MNAITKQRTVKVKLVGANTYGYEAKRYGRGDVFELPERLYEPDLFTIVEAEAKPKKKPKAEEIEAAQADVTEEEEKIINELLDTDTSTPEGKKKAQRISKKAADK